jgi:hypothetical protein
VVEFDTTIQPGRVGKISQEVDVSAMHGDNFKKSVMVTSNAVNQKGVLTLNLIGTIQPVIGLSKYFVRIKGNGVINASDSGLILKTKKVDFKINEISFVSQNSGAPTGPAWQKEIPLPVTFTLKKVAGPDSSGMITFQLLMTAKLSGTTPANGEFVLKTNHVQKNELKVRGMIDPN